MLIPGIAPGMESCILRVARTFDGVIESSPRGRPYACDHEGEATTYRLTTRVTLRITLALECDECWSIWPATQLRASGTTSARDDGFAHFVGRFTIVRLTPGKRDVPYFKGVMELIARIGSHLKAGERCDAKNHLEGWLIGRGQRPLSRHVLRAVIVARGNLSEGTAAVSDTSVNKLVGTLIRPR
jgi:hypothetical protein